MLQAFSGGLIFGERYGIGQPSIIALHGWARNRQDFSNVLAGFDAVALDLPGFGASPEPDRPLGAAGYAELVEPVLDEMTATPVVVVGHSFGGRVAVKLARARPDRIGALVLTGVPLVRPPGWSPAQPAVTYRAARWLHQHRLLSDTAMERQRRRHGSADYRDATGVMRDVLVTVVNETYEDDLPHLSGRVDLVWGELDDQVPVTVMEAAASLMASAEVETDVVAAGGHFIPTKTPDRLATAVRRAQAWLKR